MEAVEGELLSEAEDPFDLPAGGQGLYSPTSPSPRSAHGLKELISK